MTTRRSRPAMQETSLATIAVLALALAGGSAWARPLSEDEKAALAATVASFNAAKREADYARVAEIVWPPKALAAVARHAKMTPEAVVAATIKTEQAHQTGNFRTVSFEMDLDAAIHKEHASGAPYVLIPTQSISAVRGKRVRTRLHTVAVLEEGKWYLLSIGVLQIPPLREAYPEFAGVDFPRSSTEMLNPMSNP